MSKKMNGRSGGEASECEGGVKCGGEEEVARRY